MLPLEDQLDSDEVSEISVLLQGDRGTGKTRLATRYAFDSFIDARFQSQNTGAQKDVHLDDRNIHLTVNDFPSGSSRTPTNLHFTDHAWDGLDSTHEPPNPGKGKGRPQSDEVTTTGITTIPEANVGSSLNLGPDLIFASFQGDYRRSLIQRSDALMLVFNPSNRETFNWINDMVFKEIAECSQKKYLGKRVAKLLDGLADTTANQHVRPRAKSALLSTLRANGTGELSSASALTVVGSDHAKSGEASKRDSRFSKETTTIPSPKRTSSGSGQHLQNNSQDNLEITSVPSSTTKLLPSTQTQRPFLIGASPNPNMPESCEVDPDYPVLLVGACADLLEEYGGDEKRAVSIEEATVLARKFGPATGYIEVSALSDENIEVAFKTIMRQVIQVRGRREAGDAYGDQSKKLHKKQPSAQHPGPHGFWKKLAYGFSSCFGSSQSGEVEDLLNSMRTSMVSVKEAQAVTIRRFPSGASTKNTRGRKNGPVRVGRGPPPTHLTQGRSRSQAPTLKEIDPLPTLTLDDITVPDSRIGPLLPSPTESPHDSVHETPSTSSDDGPCVFGTHAKISTANPTPSNRARCSLKPLVRGGRSRLEAMEREDRAVIRTGRVSSYNVEIKSTLSVTGRYTKSTHGSIAGGIGTQTRNMGGPVGVPMMAQVYRKRSTRQAHCNRVTRPQFPEQVYI